MTTFTDQRGNGDVESVFVLASITKAERPADSDADDWYRYVIHQGTNEIVGLRQGSLRSVRLAVEEIIGRLNERRLGRSGRIHLTHLGQRRTG